MFVETDDEAAGPDEDQERQEDGDEDGVADAGHGDLEHAVQLVSGQGRGGSPGLVVPHCLITTNVARVQLTAHTTIEVRGSLTGLPIMFWVLGKV